jgi:hypothetical protein
MRKLDNCVIVLGVAGLHIKWIWELIVIHAVRYVCNRFEFAVRKPKLELHATL